MPGTVAGMRTIASWTVAWVGGAAIGVVNGIAREATYGRRLRGPVAHQVSGATAITAFAAYFRALQRRRPIPTTREAVLIGGVWLALTVAFEFGFGRAVAKQSWEELLADYDVTKGRTWPFVLAWIATGPAAVRALERRRRRRPRHQDAHPG
jgi:hypothetical protein